MPIDYEAEYNNRARVPQHPEILSHAGRGEARRLSRRSHEGAARRARAELRLIAAAVHRPVSPPPRCHLAAGAVHPWRLLAFARSVAVQPHGARAECARRRGRRGWARSLSGRDHRRDHRSDPARLPVHVAAHRAAHDGVRTLRRRTSRRRHGRDRVARALPQDPGRSRARGLFGLRRARSSRRSSRSPWRRTCGSTTPRPGASRRCCGRRRKAACSMRSRARWNRASSCARAAMWPRPGARPARKPASRPLREKTISR